MIGADAYWLTEGELSNSQKSEHIPPRRRAGSRHRGSRVTPHGPSVVVVLRRIVRLQVLAEPGCVGAASIDRVSSELMRASVKHLLAFLAGTREARVGSVQVFPPVDADQLARELNLQDRASAAGKGGQPAPDADGPDSNERSIVFEVERYNRRAREDYDEARSIYEGRIRRAQVTGSQETMIAAAAQNAVSDLRAAIVNDTNHLHVLRQEVTERERELTRFRQKNQLDRAPHLRSPRGELIVLLLFVLFVLVESVLNGMFFAKGSETGLIGGVLQAFVLSLLNVGLAFAYAWRLLPLLFDRRTTRRWGGAVLGTLFLAWLVFVNLLIGHMRDAFVAGEGNVKEAELLARLSQGPFLFDDANSLILTFLGIGLGLLALLDGASLQDLYPGYARVGRARRQAITDYSNAKAARLGRLKARRDQGIEEMTNALTRIHDAHYEIQVAIEGRQNLHRLFTAYVDDLGSLHDQLVLRYREANAQARSVSPPQYFARAVAKPAFLHPPSLDAIADTSAAARTTLEEHINQHIGSINEEFQNALHGYSTIDELTEEPKRAPA